MPKSAESGTVVWRTPELKALIDKLHRNFEEEYEEYIIKQNVRKLSLSPIHLLTVIQKGSFFGQ